MEGCFFLKTGRLAFVLGCCDNAIISKGVSGDIVGFEDCAYFLRANNLTPEHVLELNFALVHRKFTTLTLTDVHALELPMNEFVKIQQEFPSVAKRIYSAAEEKMIKLLLQRTQLKMKFGQTTAASKNNSQTNEAHSDIDTTREPLSSPEEVAKKQLTTFANVISI
jgi:hypothetical protein